MTNTFFANPWVEAFTDRVCLPTASTQADSMSPVPVYPVNYRKVQEITLDNSDTKVIAFPNYASTDRTLLYLSVVGAMRVETAGFDTNGSTPILGYTPCYGTSLYPGKLILSTYNVTTFTLLGQADGTVVEVFAAVLEADSEEAPVAVDMVEAKNTSSQTITEASANAVVLFPTVIIDPTSAFGSNVYTCQNTGVYRVSYTCNITKSSGSSTLADVLTFFMIQAGSVSLNLNTRASAFDASEARQVALEGLFNLVAGDTITIICDASILSARTYVGLIRGSSLAIDAA